MYLAKEENSIILIKCSRSKSEFRGEEVRLDSAYFFPVACGVV